MSKITRHGVEIRPSWNYVAKEPRSTMYDVLEMVESLRNVCEQIRDSQTMQCDVAQAVKASAAQLTLLVREVRGLRRDLRAKRRKP